jgi:hypothetical protein
MGKNKNKEIKIGKCNTKYRTSKNKFFFKKEIFTTSLLVMWGVCEKGTFLSLCLAKGVVDV